MKKSSLILGLGLAVIGLSAFTIKANKNIAATPEKSVIEWTGSKVIGGSHNGTIEIKENNLVFTDGKLTGGSVVADMTTIKDLDLEGEYNQKLVGHLNSDDFFGVEKFKTATIKVTKISKGSEAHTYNVTADLTIKGITHPQSFVAHVHSKEKHHVVTANVDVDRSKYNVRYGSTSFFDDLGDKAISDNFNLKVTVVSPK